MQRRIVWSPLTPEKGKIIGNFLFPFSPQLSAVTNVVFSELNVEEVMVIAAVFILPWRCAARSIVFLLFFSASLHFSRGDAARVKETHGGSGGGLLERRPLGFHIFTGRTQRTCTS